MRNDRFQSRERGNVAYYHLPGLFEFYELYRLFLSLFYTHREYFYDWCEIGSIYGAPEDCLWGGGRVEAGEAEPEEVLALMQKYGISARLTFSNSLLLVFFYYIFLFDRTSRLLADSKDIFPDTDCTGRYYDYFFSFRVALNSISFFLFSVHILSRYK